MGNPFVHVELHTSDLSKAKKFYSDLFDWKLTDMPMGNGASYTMLEVGEGTGGGMMKNETAGVPSHWMAYTQVQDVAAAIKKAEGLGGKVIQGKTEVMGMGWLGVIADPTGAVLGLWQPKG